MTDNAPDLLDQLKSKITEVGKRVDFDEARRNINTITEKVEKKLPEVLKGLRERGYEYRAHLDASASDLVAHWQTLRLDLESNIKRESTGLRQQIDGVSDALRKLATNDANVDAEAESGRRLKLGREDNTGDEPQSSRLVSKLRPAKDEKEPEPQSQARRLKLNRESAEEGDDLREKVESLVASIEERIKAFESDIEEKIRDATNKEYALTRETGLIDWYLQQFEEASFEMQPGEALVMAAKAEWVHSSSDKVKWHPMEK